MLDGFDTGSWRIFGRWTFWTLEKQEGTGLYTIRQICPRSAGTCFRISEPEFRSPSSSYLPSSCFLLFEPTLLHSDMSIKREISAADAAFLIDGLQHVASTVVVCLPNLSSSYMSGSNQMLDQVWRDCGQEGLQCRLCCTTFPDNKEPLQSQHPGITSGLQGNAPSGRWQDRQTAKGTPSEEQIHRADCGQEG
jgi:hypothetical protein